VGTVILSKKVLDTKFSPNFIIIKPFTQMVELRDNSMYF